MHLCDGSVSIETGVKNVKASIAPATDRTARLKRIPSIPNDAPKQSSVGPARVGVDMVEQSKITRPRRGRQHLGIGSVFQIFDDSQYFFGSPAIDEVDRALPLQYRMSCVQPDPGFLRCVEIGEPIDDIAQFGNDGLSMKIGRRLSARPARNSRGRDRNDVGNILALQATIVAKVTKDSTYCSRHDQYRSCLRTILVDIDGRRPIVNARSLARCCFLRPKFLRHRVQTITRNCLSAGTWATGRG